MPVSRRRLLLIWIPAGLLALLVIAVTLARLRPITFAFIIESSLSSQIGGAVSIGGMRWVGGMSLEMSDFEVRVEGIEGPAATVLSVNRMTVDITLGGGPLVQDVRMHQAVLRLAEDESRRWHLNAADLHPSGSSGGGGLPEVTIETLELESGVYGHGRFEVTGRATFTGTLTPLPDPIAGAMFHLAETSGGGASIVGVVDPVHERVAARAKGIKLGRSAQVLIPFGMVRHFTEQLQLEGEVGEIKVELERGVPPSASLWLDSLSILLDPAALDIGDSKFWVRFGGGEIQPGSATPRLVVDAGRLQFQEDRLEIVGLDGYLAGTDTTEDMVRVPYRVDFLLADLPDVMELESIDEALRMARFTLDVTAHDIELDPHQYADLPNEIARILAMFDVRQCDVNLELRMQRDDPGGEVAMLGRMEISGGQGAYERFPYPLHDLDAVIKLRGDDIVVEPLHAFGSGASQVDITGRVEATQGRDVDVHITAQDVPLDSVLMSAMPPRAMATLRDLLDPQHLDRPARDGDSHETVDLDLHVLQDEQGEPDIRGVILFDRMNVTWVEFPVTMRLGKGRIRWADRFYLEGPDGGPVTIRTAQGGGVGTLRGSVEIPTGDSPAGGEVEFDVDDEAVRPQLLAALDGMLGDTAEVLVDGDLSGMLDTAGWVRVDDGDITYDIESVLRDGSLKVTPALNTAVGMDLAGPLGGVTMLEIDGGLSATADSVHLSSIVARTDTTDLLIDGYLESPRADAQLRVDVTGVHVGPWILELLPESVRADATNIYDRWRPSGNIDGVVHMVGPSQDPVNVEVTGLGVDLVDDRRLVLRDGRTVINDHEVRFDALQLSLQQEDGPRSSVELTGTVAINKGESRIDVRADPIQLDGLIVADVLELLAGREAGTIWADLAPSGEVDLSGRWDSGDKFWAVDIDPRRVQATWNDMRLSFIDAGDSRIRFGPAGTEIVGLHGQVDDVDVSVHGRMSFDPWTIDVRGSTRGPLDGDLFRSLAGEPWVSMIEAVELEDQGRSTVEDLRVHLVEERELLSGTIAGIVELTDAQFNAGLDFRDVDARISGTIVLEAGQADVQARIEDGSARIKEATLDGARGVLETQRTPDGERRLGLRDLTADVGGGRVHADGHAAGPGGSWAIEVNLADASLERLFPETAKEALAQGKKPSTGRVEASIRLRGMSGDSNATAGVGRFRVLDGHLRTLPALVAIAQVVQLSSPLVGALSYVDVQYHIHGDEADLESILLAPGSEGSGGFSLKGSGTMDVERFIIDARLRPRGAWPMVSDVIGLLQDQLYEISLTGPIGDPTVSVVPLPGLLGRR